MQQAGLPIIQNEGSGLFLVFIPLAMDVVERIWQRFGFDGEEASRYNDWHVWDVLASDLLVVCKLDRLFDYDHVSIGWNDQKGGPGVWTMVYAHGDPLDGTIEPTELTLDDLLGVAHTVKQLLH